MGTLRAIFALILGACALQGWPVSASAGDWLPLDPAELAMKSEPKAPGAPAIYLYRQVDRDDSASHEEQYRRIKILTEEGRSYANVEIPYVKYRQRVYAVKARTIHPDGSIIEFDGTIYDKNVTKAKGVTFLAKTFSLPDVQVGSIIEYRYHIGFPGNYVYDSRWLLSDELFTRSAKFSLKPYEELSMACNWPLGLPGGSTPPRKENGAIRMESQNIPAFVTEDYMPPVDELKYRVNFNYSNEIAPEKDPDKYWKRIGKSRFRTAQQFVDVDGTIRDAVAKTIDPGDAPETKLRKLYARVQQLRNTSYEPQKTEEERKRENLKDASDAGDVWKHGYGNGAEITWLFLAMARAAGFQADPVLVSTRDQYVFSPTLMKEHELNTNVVIVRLDGKDWYLDPGAGFASFGTLPWPETATNGLRLDKDGGSWVVAPLPPAGDARVERIAQLKLDAGGTLQGHVIVTYRGLEAQWRRIAEGNEDDTERARFLEQEVKGSIPQGVEATLTNRPDWTNAETPLVAEFDLRVPGWAVASAKRTLLPLGLFGGDERHLFEHGTREHPLYFHFMYEHVDDVNIELPEHWRVSNAPAPVIIDKKVFTYATSAESSGTADRPTVHLRREIGLGTVALPARYYAEVRDFYQQVQAGDEQQVVLVVAK